MAYERFERHLDPSLAIDTRLDKLGLFGAIAEVDKKTGEEFAAFGSRLEKEIPHLKSRDLDEPAWRRLLGAGYEMVERAVADGSAKVNAGTGALDDIAAELRKAFELKRSDRRLRTYPAAGTPLEALGFDGVVTYRKIHVPFEHNRKGEPEMGFAKVIISELPSPDIDAAKYQEAIRKAGRDVFHDILRQQQLQQHPPEKLKW